MYESEANKNLKRTGFSESWNTSIEHNRDRTGFIFKNIVINNT